MDRRAARLGEAPDASRAYVFEAHDGPGRPPVVSQRVEWCAAGIVPQIDNPELQNVPRHDSPLRLMGRILWNRARWWRACLAVRRRPEPVFMTPEDIRSILLVPVFIGPGLVGSDRL